VVLAIGVATGRSRISHEKPRLPGPVVAVDDTLDLLVTSNDNWLPGVGEAVAVTGEPVMSPPAFDQFSPERL
jgi:hypothetical protein